ncbi:Flagellar motor switch protein FliM [Methylophaga frappieri]|uniref:Flagellar motor switch protein FliM n=1 Tax=Methylophaga frappieri (strain ATCC BAA-2434 / DSM 25690 / JAM7) TaxID=754477 RepID=I1YHL1_METFJ|nr:flagellar motor switch protein FliM [Methylophaga frappieri]AFJ02404.1 Flagellar motor switch protein FliM [Methylophaga frappieri]
MAVHDILSQDEVDALLNGLGDGDLDTQQPELDDRGHPRRYDFGNEERIIRGRMPTLEMINERFGRYLRINLFNMLRRSAEISVGGVQVMKFSEYVHTLFVPTSLNLIHLQPLRGTGLIVFEPKLVFTLLDNYFGGEGRFPARIEGREFTATELRVIRMVLNLCFADLTEAWAPVMPVSFEFLNHEVNPQFANIVSPSEVVVISTFHIELDGGGGDLHVTLPYAMLEPIRELLDTGLQSDRSGDDGRWSKSMREELMQADVQLSAILAKARLTLGQIRQLKAGDIIPIEMPKEVTALVEDVPMFRTQFGEHNDKAALKITGFVEHPKENTPQYPMKKVTKS